MVTALRTNVVAQYPAFAGGVDFEVSKITAQPLHQIVPFKSSSEQHYAIIMYFDRYLHRVPSYDTVQTGHLIFKSPGETNKFNNYRNVVDGYYIRFTEKYLLANRQLLSILTAFPFFEIGLLKDSPLKLQASQTEILKELYIKIYQEYLSCNAYSGLAMVNIYLQAFLLNVKRIYESLSNSNSPQTDEQPNSSGEIFRKFKSLVTLHTMGNDKGLNRKSVTEYAEMLFIHPNYLYAIVKKETGKTAREYIDTQIFKRAKSMLLQEELLIKEIAWQLSFNETAHFSNFFRRHAGIAPAEYRKQYLCVTTC